MPGAQATGFTRNRKNKPGRKQSPRFVSGEKTILEAKREIRYRQRDEAKEANQVLVQQAPALLTAGDGRKFSTIVIDPPWDYSEEDGPQAKHWRARPTYATMSTEEDSQTSPQRTRGTRTPTSTYGSRTVPCPRDSRCSKNGAFATTTMLTWVKPSFGMGNYFRGSTEHILFGTRGSLPLLRNDVGTHFTAKRSGGHSSKPPEFYELVESCSPGPWIEIFARGQRPGWTACGARSAEPARQRPLKHQQWPSRV